VLPECEDAGGHYERKYTRGGWEVKENADCIRKPFPNHPPLPTHRLNRDSLDLRMAMISSIFCLFSSRSSCDPAKV